MKTLRVLVFVLTLMLAASAFAAGFEGLNFEGEPYITFDPATVSFYLTIPEIQVGDLRGWVKWKLNLSNYAAWEVVAADLESNIHGTATSSGKYIYDPQRSVLILDVQNTDYLGCGFEKGVQVFFVSSLTSSTMTIVDPLEDEVITLTRQGVGSDILGTWNAMLGSNTFSVTLNGDGTFTGVANVVQCLD